MNGADGTRWSRFVGPDLRTRPRVTFGGRARFLDPVDERLEPGHGVRIRPSLLCERVLQFAERPRGEPAAFACFHVRENPATTCLVQFAVEQWLQQRPDPHALDEVGHPFPQRPAIVHSLTSHRSRTVIHDNPVRQPGIPARSPMT